MQFSYSRVSCFKHCPYQFKLRYIDKYKTVHDPEPNNALIIGNALHLGIEKNMEKALKFYKSQFHILSDLHIEEMIKLEYVIPKVKSILEGVDIYAQEKLISTKRFKGIVDLITKNEDGSLDVLDFKYSNNIDNYLESAQLHIYKYFLEKQGFKVNRLGFIFAPKVSIRRKKNEETYQFRNRLLDELNGSEVKLVEIKYNPNKVIEFFSDMTDIVTANDYKKNVTRLCSWCEFENYCIKGDDYMLLPSNERRTLTKVSKKAIWIYGAPFSGKTYLANQFPNVLMLNTDGNVEFIDAPYIPIKDKIEMNGRVTNKTLAWQIFKEAMDELEKNQNDFETIVVDLLEDMYEYCRLYMYDKLKITHESDDSFRAWDKVRIEFLSTIKRLRNLDYNIVFLSHEDTSKDLTKKSGDKISKIAPNLQEKAANKIAGMVDIVARAINEGDDYILSFTDSEVEFGGGRLGIKGKEIESSYENLMNIYDDFNNDRKDVQQEEIKIESKEDKNKIDRKSKKLEKQENEETVEKNNTEKCEEIKEESKRSRRRKKSE